MFYIGQKVVCINDRFPQRILEWTSDLPREGQIYTIRSISRGKSLYTGESKLGFRLEELREGHCGFFADRFAPLVEKLDQACQRNARELTSPARVELPVVTPAVRIERVLQGPLSASPRLRGRRLSMKVRSENAAIRKAVLRAAAQEQHKSAFMLFGRGHEPRVSLSVSLAALLRGLDIPRVHISGFGANYYYPRRVFVRAIRTLKQKLGRSPIALLCNTVYRIHDVEDHLAPQVARNL